MYGVQVYLQLAQNRFDVPYVNECSEYLYWDKTWNCIQLPRLIYPISHILHLLLPQVKSPSVWEKLFTFDFNWDSRYRFRLNSTYAGPELYLYWSQVHRLGCVLCNVHIVYITTENVVFFNPWPCSSRWKATFRVSSWKSSPVPSPCRTSPLQRYV